MTDLEPRVVVVGGGIVGLSTAWHLVLDGCRTVTVLEAGQVGGGSSGRSVGMVETQYLDAHEIAMRAYGRRFFDGLEREHGLLFAHEGYLRLAHDQAELAAFEASAAIQAEEGCDGRVVDAAEVAELVPDLAPGVYVGGLWGPTDGYVDGYLCCQLLARLVRDAGGRVRQACRLLGAASAGAPQGGWVLATSGGEVPADIVVNAAGAWAGRVGELLGAPLDLAPQLHEVVRVELGRPLGYTMPFVMDYVPGSNTEGVYFRRDGAEGLLAGLHSDEAVYAAVDADTVLPTPGADFAERLVPRLADLLPGVGDAALAQGWSGLYPTSLDGFPVVGPHPEVPSVICAAGPGGVGIQLSPAMGRAAAEFCLGSASSLAPGSSWSATRLRPAPKHHPQPHPQASPRPV